MRNGGDPTTCCEPQLYLVARSGSRWRVAGQCEEDPNVGHCVGPFYDDRHEAASVAHEYNADLAATFDKDCAAAHVDFRDDCRSVGPNCPQHGRHALKVVK